MDCKSCGRFWRRNLWKCPECGANIKGGIVFVTGISGSGVREVLKKVKQEAENHKHKVLLHDIGQIMRSHAHDDDPDVRWEKILDVDEKALRHLRALAFQDLTYGIKFNRDALHLVDLHLSFRWRAYLMKGFEPHIVDKFAPQVRCFINIVEDLSKIHQRLKDTSWGDRRILELLIWRDEELFLADLFANACGRVSCFAIAASEPPSVIEQIIWHPEKKKVYLSFPITHLKDDHTAQKEITDFRDRVREFLIVFDPFATKDYDETYKKQELGALRKEVGETTEDRDYRFIDQADAVVVYYPAKVPSTGVDAEMNHARRTGKDIYLYSPEDPKGGPFVVPPDYFRSNTQEFIELLKEKLAPERL